MKRFEALEFLNNDFIHSIKDPLWQNIAMTKPLKNLVSTKDVQKLARIKQNGPAYHIYPGAVHTRLNHSIGVYYLGRKILISLASRCEDLPLTKTGMMSFLVACLLHDIGHFPYAHSLKELAIREHEEIASSMIKEDGELKDAIEKTGADYLMVANIIDKDAPSSDEQTNIYRGILSGTLDPDKLDYLSRDGFFSGLPYGKQDTDYIISSLAFSDGSICLDHEAISSVEQVLFSKYMMYKTLYWHKGVRSATSMIKKALIIAIEEKTIDYNELYFLDDFEFNLLCKEREAKCEALFLVDRVEHNQLLDLMCSKDYNSNGLIEKEGKKPNERRKFEREIHSELSRKYPKLKEYEVILDIPEDINFETHINILMPDKSVHPIEEERLIFSSSVSKEFQKNLRKVSLYLPGYVKQDDASKVFERIYNGK